MIFIWHDVCNVCMGHMYGQHAALAVTSDWKLHALQPLPRKVIVIIRPQVKRLV